MRQHGGHVVDGVGQHSRFAVGSLTRALLLAHMVDGKAGDDGCR
jgi:hypothetical protein